MTSQLLWTPSEKRKNNSRLVAFADWLKEHNYHDWQGDYLRLWQWSVDEKQAFWSSLWDWHRVIGDKSGPVMARLSDGPQAMMQTRFFPDANVNFAENLLCGYDQPDIGAMAAIASHHENGIVDRMTRAELADKAMRMAGWLKAQGVQKGDRVAAYIPNIAEAVITMLASSAIGAVYSSCSPDFGFGGVRDRFGQIEPKILVTVDGYRYNGKEIDRLEIIAQLTKAMPSIHKVLVKGYLSDQPDLSSIPQAALLADAYQAEPITAFEPMGFNDPLYILYSSGTTGAPKCIVHGIGGTLLQHIKEGALHADIKPGDSVFYFTTCGWMMWNWLVSALTHQAKIVLYEGNPFAPGPERLWQMAETEEVSLFGTSAKYIDAVRKSGYEPAKSCDLSALQTICSTGSPLTSDGFAFVYKAIKEDVHLASISGGTDIVSCFVLGTPVRSVYAGEIQARGLGMDVAVLNDEGQPVRGTQGELCCLSAFPAQPIGFWNDPDNSRYQDAYFNHFEGIWRHGDWATLTEHDGIIIHGRSDATLNPGGVRIGTAEIYRPVEAFDEVAEALVIGQTISDDVRVVLFIRLAVGAVLDEALIKAIKSAVRSKASPRHVPAKIIAVADIPRTRSGKITELAVRDVIHGRPVKNTEALANPEALDLYRDLPELNEDN
ncbi:MAG: acetoacetate--CoA ligase [Candidatus Puniceispirillaceae bacterium]